MPYKFETNKIKLPRQYDRRVKLTDDDKRHINNLYIMGLSIRKIARIYENKCCRRMIQFVLFPERLKMAKLNYDWRNYYNKQKHTIAIRNHRRYKNKILNLKGTEDERIN